MVRSAVTSHQVCREFQGLRPQLFKARQLAYARFTAHYLIEDLLATSSDNPIVCELVYPPPNGMDSTKLFPMLKAIRE
jgi:hypothetical protein